MTWKATPQPRRLPWALAVVAGLFFGLPLPASATVYVWSANGHGYEAVLAVRTWQQAQNECLARGGYLASITSDAENCLVYGLFGLDPNYWFVDSFNNGLGPWFGGQQVPGTGEPVGTWQWASGEPWGFANWAPGDPDNCCGLNQNRTIFFRPSNTGLGCGWDDAEEVPPVGFVRGYIFETNTPPPGAPVLQTPSSCCGVTIPQVGVCEPFDGSNPSPPSRWISGGSACGSPDVADGELRMTQAAGCPGGGQSITLDPTRYVIKGDFDIAVDYRLPDFSVPGPGGDRVMGLRLLDLADNYFATIERYNRVLGACNPSQQNYKAWFTNSLNCDPAVTWTPTTDTQGKFRIARLGTTVNEYYWNSGWILLNSATLPSSDVQLVLFSANANGSSSYEVRFDNLCISANVVTAVASGGPRNAPGLELFSAAPNPFSSATRLEFHLPATGRVRIDVLDVSGRRVDTVLNSTLGAGEHFAIWSPRGRRSGVYMIRLQGPGGVATKRVLLAK